MSELAGIFDPLWWCRFWGWPAVPNTLVQPILPGWSFGGITINEQNSSAPETEREIVSVESYGRQIGKLLDALAELLRERQDAHSVPAFEEVLDLKTRVDVIKRTAAERHARELLRDLEVLRESHPETFEGLIAALDKRRRSLPTPSSSHP